MISEKRQLLLRGTAGCDHRSDRTAFGEKDQIQDISGTDPDSLLAKLHSCGYRSFFPGIIIAVNAGVNGAEWYTGSRQPKKIGGPGCFQDCGSKKICMPKKQKTGYSRKKTAAKIPVTREKYASFFPEEQVWTQSAGKVQTGFRYKKEQP